VFEIGNSLLEARSRRGVDFVQAELATKIRAKYLRALEEERFEQLPSQTYVKGFLRTYADYLGLDGQLYVDEYNSRFVVGEDVDFRPRRSTVRPERRTRRLETGIVLVAVVVVAIVTLVVVSAWQTSGSGAKAPPAPARKHVAKKHTSPRLSAYLQIDAVKGPSYVLVHRNGPRGKQLFEGTIGKGRVEPFSGRHFWVSLSSPENLIVIVGGKAVPLAGGKPVVLTVTPSGVRTD
jgi:helix-turn-helix protein